MNLETFHTLVRNSIARGTSMDDMIPLAVRQAVRWLERNYSLGYMHKFKTFTLLSSGADPRIVAMPHARVKAVKFLRLLLPTGQYAYLTQVMGQEVDSPEGDIPAGYWVEGERLWLDTPPKEDFPAELLWVEYTEWPTVGTAEHWLLNHAEDVLLAQTVLQLGPQLRDDKLMGLYKGLRDEGLRTLTLAEDERNQSNANLIMR